MSTTTYATQVNREAPEFEALKMGLLDEARRLYSTPVNLPAVEAAGLSLGQLQAADLARQGIGAYEPYMQAASQGVTQGMGLTQQGAQQLGNLDLSKQFGAAQDYTYQGANLLDRMNLSPQFGAAQGAFQGALGATSKLGGLGDVAAGYSAADTRRATQQLEAAMQQAGGIEAAGAGALQAGIGALGAQGYKDYMDPYQEQVIAATRDDLARQGGLARSQLASQALRAGAFGGTREGVQRGILEGELARNEANVLANLRSQGFNTAQQNALNRAGLYSQLGSTAAALRAQQAGLQGQLAGQSAQQAFQGAQLGQAGTALQGQLAGQEAGLYGQLGQGIGSLAAQQGGLEMQRAGMLGSMGAQIGQLGAQQGGLELQRAGLLGNLGGQMGQLGVQQGALGQTLQGLGVSDVNLMGNIGTMEQQNAQAQLDAIRATQTQESMLPFQQLGFVSDIYRGAPTTQMSLTSQTAPTASPLQSALGLGIAGLSAASGAQKVGLFG